MKKSPVFLLFVSVLSLSTAFAEESDFQGNVAEGVWKLSGSMEFFKEYGDDKDHGFFLGSSGQYFFSDALAAGVEIGLTELSYRSPTALSFGPVASWYFAKTGSTAFFAQFGATFGLTNSAPDLILSPALGASVFLNKYVAFGPTVAYEIYDFSSDTYLNDYRRLQILASFHLYF